MNTVLVRRDVTKLGEEWHPVLRAYALAVGRMADLPETDPRSMQYQASVHGVGDETDPPPDDFLSQCQHNCWYFLPWHRWYLYYFEQIVRSMFADIDEIDEAVAQDWALPYWDYAQPGAAELPPEFANPTLWNGDPNPLFDPSRLPDVNSRDAAVDPLEAVPPPSAFTQPFSVDFPNAASFGGSSAGWQHFVEAGAIAGALEGQPHNTVHGFVGGNMWRFATAGLDPVFWLHHCNIDRYWEVFGHDSDPSG